MKKRFSSAEKMRLWVAAIILLIAVPITINPDALYIRYATPVLCIALWVLTIITLVNYLKHDPDRSFLNLLVNLLASILVTAWSLQYFGIF